MRIYRATDVSEPIVTFNATSAYKASLLNRSNRQLLFGLQELSENTLHADEAETAARIAGDANVYSSAVTYVNNRTKADIGLGNVDNTSDMNKPVSTAQANAISSGDAATLASATAYTDSKANKTSVGLCNVDNTSDANKPVSTAQAAAIASGDTSTLNTAKSYADTQDAATLASAKAYTDTKATKAAIGLGNVDNTSDANKPISTATQTALNAKANTASLGSAAYANTSAFANSAQGAKADTAVQSIVAGTNISVDSTDPRNPIITAVGGGGGGRWRRNWPFVCCQ